MIELVVDVAHVLALVRAERRDDLASRRVANVGPVCDPVNEQLFRDLLQCRLASRRGEYAQAATEGRTHEPAALGLVLDPLE